VCIAPHVYTPSPKPNTIANATTVTFVQPCTTIITITITITIAIAIMIAHEQRLQPPNRPTHTGVFLFVPKKGSNLK